MGTVVDELIVVLGLDPKQFNEGQKEALAQFKKTQEQAEQMGKNVEAQGKKINEFFSRLKSEAIGLTAAFFGGRGVKEFFQYITQVDAATGRLAHTLNESTRDLSAWQGVATLTGGSADTMASSMSGLSGAINTFMLTGQSSFLPVLNSLNISLFDQNHRLKTASQLYLDLSKAIEGMDPARATALLGMIPGMNRETINTLLLGHDAVQKLLNDQKKLGTISDEDAASAQKLAKAWGEAEQGATSLGRSIVTWLQPALTNMLETLTAISTRPANILRQIGHWFLPSFIKGTEPEPLTSVPPQTGPSSAFSSKTEKEAFIRSEFIKNGHSPDIAMAVAKSEGFNNFYGDPDATGKPTSFTAFQLHYPGIGRNTADGLGTQFTRDTGLDVRDPKNERAAISWVASHVGKMGWGAWHGWRGSPWAGLNTLPVGASTSAIVNNSTTGSSSATTSSMSIGKIEIHTPARDTDGIARDITKSLMERTNFAAPANYGQQ